MKPFIHYLSPAAAALAGCLVLLSSCAVGPDFKHPPPPAAPDYGAASSRSETASSEGLAGNRQQLIIGRDIPAEWWKVFHSPKLDQLVAQTLHANPDVRAAQAALRQAHELYAAQKAALLPLLQANVSATHAKNPTGTIANPTTLPQTSSYYNLYTTELDLSYVPDVFGPHAVPSKRPRHSGKALVFSSRRPTSP